MEAAIQKFRVSVLINAYNYGRFIAEAVESVLAQTHSVDELIIVDDGSTDDTAEVTKAAIKDAPNAKLIQQANGGQLSAMQTGILNSTGDICFFLDADDLWRPGHVATYLETYNSDPTIDYVYSGHTKFGGSTEVEQHYEDDVYHGITALETIYRNTMVGSPTSGVSAKRELLNRFCPFDQQLLNNWKICGDDVINRACSLFLGIKYHLKSQTVLYRVHGENNYHSATSRSRSWKLKDILRGYSITHYLSEKAGLSADLKHHFRKEFCTNPHPNAKIYKEAVETTKLLGLPFTKYIYLRYRMWQLYLKKSRK